LVDNCFEPQLFLGKDRLQVLATFCLLVWNSSAMPACDSHSVLALKLAAQGQCGLWR